MQKTPDFYDFCGVRLFVADLHIEIPTSGKEYIPSPIHRSFLLVLLRKHPEVAAYEELWRDAWRSQLEMSDTDLRNIQTTKGQLTLWFKDKIDGNLPIEAVPGTGYCLKCEVIPGWNETTLKIEFSGDQNIPRKRQAENNSEIQSQSDINDEKNKRDADEDDKHITIDVTNAKEAVKLKTASWQQLFYPHMKYVLATGFFYGLLYFITAVMEIAYKFDVYGIKALFFGGVFLIINFAAAMASLAVICRRIAQGKPALLPAVALLACPGIITILLSVFYLPFTPITEASLQTQPAIIAFGKNVLIYFQPLGIVFLLMPFYAALAEKLKDTKLIEKIPFDVIFIKPWHLLIIYLGAVIFSLLTTNHLLDNLKSESNYHTLFSGLIFLRFIVYFGLGLGSIIWYYSQLNKEKV